MTSVVNLEMSSQVHTGTHPCELPGVKVWFYFFPWFPTVCSQPSSSWSGPTLKKKKKKKKKTADITPLFKTKQWLPFLSEKSKALTVVTKAADCIVRTWLAFISASSLNIFPRLPPLWSCWSPWWLWDQSICSGHLHWLFPPSGSFFLHDPMAHSFASFKVFVKCHLLNKDFPSYII